MGHEQSSVEMFKFTWKIENVSYLNTYEVKWGPFVLDGYTWMIYLYPKGEEGSEDYLSIFLEVVKTANVSEEWSRDVKFKLSLFDQLGTIIFTKEYSQEFNVNAVSCGFKTFITLYELHPPEMGFIVKDACMVGGQVYVCKQTYEKPVRPKLEGDQNQNAGELKDFMGLGQIEKDFVPLLAQACSLHPSLIVCQRERSGKFREWAFTALGRVLYFLKAKKVKDMNVIVCKELQGLWKELEHFGFDLTWLEPHVQSALGMESYLKKFQEVEKIKDNVLALELEMQRLKEKMATAKDLLEVLELEEIDLESELGFVKS